MDSAPRIDPLLGQVVGQKYEVIRFIGKGGMGAVYEVRHRELGASFALKKLNPDLLDDEESLTRFRREAQVVARFRHPSIVGVTDWETLEDGSPCIIMELLQGEDLGTRLKRGALAWPALGSIADQVLSALSVAHRAGVVHRDLKPQNIFLAQDDAGDERAMILDFGLSKVRGAMVTTTSERLIGTPAYMSPEQADGQAANLGPETDVWAMGAILFEMATGRQAFPAPSVPAILYRICHGVPEPLHALRSDIPPLFGDLVRRALSHDPERRIRSVDELRRGLREALAGDTAAALAEPPPSGTSLHVPAAGSGSVAKSSGSPPRLPDGSVPASSVPVEDVLDAASDAVAAVSAAPRSGLRLLMVALATILVAAAVVALLLPGAPGRKAAPPVEAAPPVPAVVPGRDAAPATAPTTAQQRTLRVLVNSTPAATVHRGRDEVGTTPLNLPVTVGERVQLRLVANGYRPKDVEVDGRQERVEVRLERMEPGPSTGAGKRAPVEPPAPEPVPPPPAPRKTPPKVFKLEGKPLDIPLVAPNKPGK
ncbi:MAG: serine/threonine protein kinase [Deltaproteobacteria bacterium]|nr:serine/threonine protein kinase [Deltaproteobacteria bacterium]